MKRYLSVLCAAMLCVCCLVLAACGGGAPASSSSGGGAAASQESGSAASESSSAAADPAEKFVGDWKLAAVEMQGITLTGDFEGSGILGTAMNVTLNISEDGTGAMALNEESGGLTWELKGDNTMTITPTVESDAISTIDVTYDDGVLSMMMNDDEMNGRVMLSPDGTMDGLREITAANATDITSQDDLVGTWRLAGLNMMGMSMYGDADDLAAMTGGSEAPTLVISADGTATLMDEEATWSVGPDGATLESDGAAIPLKSLDGDLVVDAGSMLDIGMDMIMLFTR